MHPPTDDIVPSLPPNVPRVPRHRLSRWIGRSVLRLGGWRVVGEFPDLPRVVLIGAPHSSNWDGIWGFAAKLALGLDIRILGKHQLFWGPLGPLMRALGIIAINRGAASGVVGQMAQQFRGADRFWLGIAPEGTRKPVARWKTGFWKIAHAAQVPVLPVYFHYPDRVIGIGPPFATSHDMEADLVRLREWYRPWQGKHHGTD
ncbi:MAG: lysophospholipid acyltransferase family protein [Lysobacter sp.]|jgi:1-acyl-sn-glycerol-3-phosphate acyltransferase|nr:lysophospholipid acyltransferase family protein [Lysobacter sp.]MDV5980121.1 lysophospholipid acyltransferase family protein [Lysobacter sp.]